MIQHHDATNTGSKDNTKNATSVFPFLGGDGQQILELASQECTNQSLHCSTNQPMGNRHLQIDR